MKVADDRDYDVYAEHLAGFLADHVELYGQQGWRTKPREFFYNLIQEFNRSME